MKQQDMTSYIYTDKFGNPLYRQNRYYKDGEKSFYGEKFENGEWIKGLDGVERVLYKLPKVIEGVSKAEKIYFVEGEKDVETLIHKGKIATTIAGGANQKWLDSYTEILKSADIIIIPDNDKAGQEFATRVADSLTGNANTVKVIQLTDVWTDLKEKGDITDVFEMVGNDEAVLEKLEELEQNTKLYIAKVQKEKVKKQKEFEIADLNLKLKIPKNYTISMETGIKTFYYKDGEKIEVAVAPIPIVLSKVLKNIDTEEEKVELSFYRKGRWEKIVVDKNILYNSRNIVNLANKGIPITSSKAKKVMDWLYELEIANVENLKVDKTTNHFGWIDDKTFVPYRNNDVQLDLEPGIASWLNKFNEKRGTISQWVANIKEFLDDDETGIIRFIIATRI